MTDIVNEWLRTAKKSHSETVRDQMKCADGFTMSVQASGYHYCAPREHTASHYESVEVGFPSMAEAALLPFAEDADRPTETVYGWVPVAIVAAVIESHGGIAS